MSERVEVKLDFHQLCQLKNSLDQLNGNIVGIWKQLNLVAEKTQEVSFANKGIENQLKRIADALEKK